MRRPHGRGLPHEGLTNEYQSQIRFLGSPAPVVSGLQSRAQCLQSGATQALPRMASVNGCGLTPRSTTGPATAGRLGPVWRYAVHFRQPGPSRPAAAVRLARTLGSTNTPHRAGRRGFEHLLLNTLNSKLGRGSDEKPGSQVQLQDIGAGSVQSRQWHRPAVSEAERINIRSLALGKSALGATQNQRL